MAEFADASAWVVPISFIAVDVAAVGIAAVKSTLLRTIREKFGFFKRNGEL